MFSLLPVLTRSSYPSSMQFRSTAPLCRIAPQPPLAPSQQPHRHRSVSSDATTQAAATTPATPIQHCHRPVRALDGVVWADWKSPPHPRESAHCAKSSVVWFDGTERTTIAAAVRHSDSHSGSESKAMTVRRRWTDEIGTERCVVRLVQ